MPFFSSWFTPKDSWSERPKSMSLVNGIQIEAGLAKELLVSWKMPCDIRVKEAFKEVRSLNSKRMEARGSNISLVSPSDW